MEIPKNAFKRALAEGRRPIGFWLSLGSPAVAELVAGAGYDWVLVDTEHAPNEVPDVIDQLRALEGGTASPVVRPAWNDPVLIKRLLDAGAQSLLVPFVRNAEEAASAVAATRYPPQGIRGVATITRASGYGRVSDYVRRAEDELCVVVQLETRGALAELEAIAAVPGVDALFVGPSDLAADLGHPGEARPSGGAGRDHGRLRPLLAPGQAARHLCADRGRRPSLSRHGRPLRRGGGRRGRAPEGGRRAPRGLPQSRPSMTTEGLSAGEGGTRRVFGLEWPAQVSRPCPARVRHARVQLRCTRPSRPC